MTTRLFHLVAGSNWPTDPTAYHPGSLDEEGFIHLSDASQVPATSVRFYAGVPDLLLVELDPRRLTAEVRWEDLVGHGAFPHLYGRIDIDAVVSVSPYRAGSPIDS
jgi:uncharacterized protein (DUF952 family)